MGPGGFVYQGDRLVCPQGKTLHQRGFNRKEQRYMYTARREDCQACPIKSECLPPRQKRGYVSLTRYYPMTLLAKERNQTSEYRRERARRQTIAEGTFASLDRLGWARTRLRGLWKVDCEGYMAALAHNVKKLMRRLRQGIGPPDLALPPAAADTETQGTRDNAVSNSVIPTQHRLRQGRRTMGPGPRIPEAPCRRR